MKKKEIDTSLTAFACISIQATIFANILERNEEDEKDVARGAIRNIRNDKPSTQLGLNLGQQS
jgi:hypothetical protein